MNENEIAKLVEIVKKKKEERENRLLKDLKPYEIWNEFANSNLRLRPWNDEKL